MKMTGQILKENREKKGLTLNEVALATKINSKILAAIESGDIDSLPQRAFLRGFIQTYATFLELDVDNILTMFIEEMGNVQSKWSQKPAKKTADEHTSNLQVGVHKKSMALKIVIAVFILVGLFVVRFLFKTVERYERERQKPTPAEIADALNKEVSPKADSAPALPGEHGQNNTENAVLEKKRVMEQQEVAKKKDEKKINVAEPIAKIVEKPKPLEVAPRPVVTTPNVVVPTPKPVVSVPQQPAVVAKPIEKSPVAVNSTPAKEHSENETISVDTGAVIPSKELIIEALDDVIVTLTVDGGPSKRITLEADKVQIIKAKENIKLGVNDGGAVNITFNGTDLGVPGALGKPIQLSYP